MKNKLRIGILCNNLQDFRNWEYRIFEKLMNADWAEVILIVKDGRKKNRKSDLVKLINSKNFIGKALFKIITKFESRIFKEKQTANKSEVIRFLGNIEKIEINPSRKGFVDFFDKIQSDKIKEYDLDVLLRHGFNIIKGDILNIPKYGIWSFHHADNDINRGSPAGFWEIVLKQPITGVTLQKLTTELDGGLILDKSFYNTKFSFFQNNSFILEKSVTLLIKNLKLLYITDELKYQPSKVYSRKLFKTPNPYWILKYQRHFWSTITKNIINRVSMAIGFRPRMWTLFFGKRKLLKSTLHHTKSIQPKKSEFWADPFVMTHNNKNYVFFENYSYKSNKGKISFGILNKGNLESVEDALVCDYHLSYPFLIKDNDEIFMLPETCENKRLEVWKAINFPNEWELYSTGFEGKIVADPTIFKDKENNYWLFINISDDPFHDLCSELYIYKIDGLKLEEIIPHKLNPVVVDARYARNGGNIFYDNNDIIRPSQNNINSIYGYGLNISRITKLSLHTYKEELITTILPEFKKGLIATHHLCQFEDGFVIDGCYKFKK